MSHHYTTNLVKMIHTLRLLGHSYGSTTSNYGVADARPGTVDDDEGLVPPARWLVEHELGNNYVMNFENEELIGDLNNPLRWISGIQDVDLGSTLRGSRVQSGKSGS